MQTSKQCRMKCRRCFKMMQLLSTINLFHFKLLRHWVSDLISGLTWNLFFFRSFHFYKNKSNFLNSVNITCYGFLSNFIFSFRSWNNLPTFVPCSGLPFSYPMRFCQILLRWVLRVVKKFRRLIAFLNKKVFFNFIWGAPSRQGIVWPKFSW